MISKIRSNANGLPDEDLRFEGLPCPPPEVTSGPTNGTSLPWLRPPDSVFAQEPVLIACVGPSSLGMDGVLNDRPIKYVGPAKKGSPRGRPCGHHCGRDLPHK